mgnify:CR=1 FL=1
MQRISSISSGAIGMVVSAAGAIGVEDGVAAASGAAGVSKRPARAKREAGRKCMGKWAAGQLFFRFRFLSVGLRGTRAD